MKRFNVVALAIIGLLFLSARVHASSLSLAGYYLLDQNADQYDTDVDGDGVVDLLASITTNGLRFKVDDGEELSIEFDESLLTNKVVINHEDFVAALQSPLLNLIAQGKVPADTTLTVRPDMTKTTYLDDGSRSSDIPAIVLQTGSGSVLEPLGFTWAYNLPGDYTVYGRIFADEEESEDLQISAVIHPDSGTSPLETSVTFTIESGTPPFMIFLDYGDGSMSSEFDLSFSLTTLNYSYTYSNPGSYIAQFTVMDANSEITKAVNIQVNDPANQNNIVLTDTSSSATITAGSDKNVYGTAEANSITLESGAKAELFNFAGNNTIIIQADSSIFTVSRSGAYVTFEGSDGTVLTMPAATTAQSIIFNDMSTALVIENDQILLGAQNIGISENLITPDANTGLRSVIVKDEDGNTYQVSGADESVENFDVSPDDEKNPEDILLDSEEKLTQGFIKINFPDSGNQKLRSQIEVKYDKVPTMIIAYDEEDHEYYMLPFTVSDDNTVMIRTDSSDISILPVYENTAAAQSRMSYSQRSTTEYKQQFTIVTNDGETLKIIPNVSNAHYYKYQINGNDIKMDDISDVYISIDISQTGIYTFKLYDQRRSIFRVWEQDIFVQAKDDLAGINVKEIAEKYAPILAYNDNEEYFPVTLNYIFDQTIDEEIPFEISGVRLGFCILKKRYKTLDLLKNKR